MRIAKITSAQFAGKMIAAGVVIGGVIPLLVWLLFVVFLIPLVIAGGIILAVFGIIWLAKRHQDHSKNPVLEQHLRDEVKFDPSIQYAVIRSSICTGEKVAGFKNKTDGHFTEVMLIKDPEDEKRFRETYGLETVKVEY